MPFSHSTPFFSPPCLCLRQFWANNQAAYFSPLNFNCTTWSSVFQCLINWQAPTWLVLENYSKKSSGSSVGSPPWLLHQRTLLWKAWALILHTCPNSVIYERSFLEHGFSVAYGMCLIVRMSQISCGTRILRVLSWSPHDTREISVSSWDF